MVQRVWRVGHRSSPLGFIPPERRLYAHRFDDPQRQYGTLYCAEFRTTCLRERLADLRPSTNFQVEFAREFGASSPFIAAGFVSWRLREASMLAPAVIRVESGTEIADLGEQILLRQLEMEHAKLLADYGIEHLDIEQVMTTHRAVTQAISRSLYENGACGIRYYSHLDMQPCFAVFEGRTELEAAGDFEPLTDDIPELLQVASDYHIVLQRVEMNLVDVAEAEVQLGALRDRHSRWREEIQTAHRQVLEVRERVERYGMTFRSILERVGSELEDIRRTAEEPDPAQTAQVKSAQILEKLQRATEAIQRLQSEAESTPRFQRERHRLNEEARELEQALTRYQARIQEGRFPPHIEAESRLLLEDVRSWWPSMPSES